MNLSACSWVGIISIILMSTCYGIFLFYTGYIQTKEIDERRTREAIKESSERLERSKKAIKESNERLSDNVIINEDPIKVIKRYNIKRDPDFYHKVEESENTIDPFDGSNTATRVDKQSPGKLLRVIYEFAKE